MTTYEIQNAIIEIQHDVTIIMWLFIASVAFRIIYIVYKENFG